MTNTAKQTESNPIDVEGLDDLYDANTTTDAVITPTEDDAVAPVADCETTAADKIEVVDDGDTTNADIVEWLPTIQAAARLGKSERTVQRYAKAGKLESKTDDSGKLLIGFATLADSVTPEDDSQPTQDTNITTNADSSNATADKIYDKVIEDYRSQISELQDKLERTTFQLGRMQSDLEHKDNEIKLLTDKKLELTKWQRFKKWFIGG